MRKGLAAGALLLRRWRKHSHIGKVHPWRWAAARVLRWPIFSLLGLMCLLAWIGERLARLDPLAEYWASRFWDCFVETEREHELRKRAWFGRKEAGNA